MDYQIKTNGNQTNSVDPLQGTPAPIRPEMLEVIKTKNSTGANNFLKGPNWF